MFPSRTCSRFANTISENQDNQNQAMLFSRCHGKEIRGLTFRIKTARLSPTGHASPPGHRKVK